MGQYREKLKTFTESSLPDLDEVVLGALELFEEAELPELKLDMYKRPLVVGSENAEVTGRIMFKDTDALFADESTYEHTLARDTDIDGVVIISASGGKHSPIIAKCSRDLGKHVTLITTTDDSQTGSYLDHQHEHDEFVFPKNREPYTYNTSTYMGMILSKSKEDPAMLRNFIETDTSRRIPDTFADYDAFYLIIPAELLEVRDMLLTKFDELFGSKVSGRVFDIEQTKHAKTIVPSEKELFISFGEKNELFGVQRNRLHIPLPENAGHAALMAIGYFVIGHIQKAHPPYFKENIVEYAKEASRIFGSPLLPIVE